MNLKTFAYMGAAFLTGGLLMNDAKDNIRNVHEKRAVDNFAKEHKIDPKVFGKTNMECAMQKAYFLGEQAVRDSVKKAAKVAL